MKTIILAFSICMATSNAADPAGFTAALTSINNPGALGYLVDNVPQDLTDCCGNNLIAK